jgi:hypothetical protein
MTLAKLPDIEVDIPVTAAADLVKAFFDGTPVTFKFYVIRVVPEPGTTMESTGKVRVVLRQSGAPRISK